MVLQPPPKNFAGAVATSPLPAGSVLWRVHRREYGTRVFNPVGSEVLFGGGRFDGTTGCEYPYLYAALRPQTAVAEALLRDVKANDRGARFVAKTYWDGRTLTALRTTEPVQLVAIRTGAELGTIGQDTWLTTCDPPEYPQTREWGHWLRDRVPDAAGIVWLSKRDPGEPVMVLFGDRCPPELLEDEDGPLAGRVGFEEPAGFEWLRETLRGFNVTIRSPNFGP